MEKIVNVSIQAQVILISGLKEVRTPILVIAALLTPMRKNAINAQVVAAVHHVPKI
jgi:hypothetical protein